MPIFDNKDEDRDKDPKAPPDEGGTQPAPGSLEARVTELESGIKERDALLGTQNEHMNEQREEMLHERKLRRTAEARAAAGGTAKVSVNQPPEVNPVTGAEGERLKKLFVKKFDDTVVTIGHTFKEVTNEKTGEKDRVVDETVSTKAAFKVKHIIGINDHVDGECYTCTLQDGQKLRMDKKE